MLLQPDIFSKKVIAAQSTRLGGHSQKPYDSLNLGKSTADDPQVVVRNRETFFGSLGIGQHQLVINKQVHGTNVLVANAPGIHEGYDASITNVPGVFLVVSVADCTPVLIHDEKNGAVAAIHAGWRGTAGKIVSNALVHMQKHYGTQGHDCKAFIGACITYTHFEVGEEVAQHFESQQKRFDQERQKFFVDLKQANAQQLIDFGLPKQNIHISEYCTVQHNHLFFSHRHEKGVTGRMMAVIGMKDPQSLQGTANNPHTGT